MDFLALNDDVKFIISKHLASDLKIRALLSKNHDLQKYYLETFVCARVVCACVCVCVCACLPESMVKQAKILPSVETGKESP
jgi:hypothetical protein